MSQLAKIRDKRQTSFEHPPHPAFITRGCGALDGVWHDRVIDCDPFEFTTAARAESVAALSECDARSTLIFGVS